MIRKIFYAAWALSLAYSQLVYAGNVRETPAVRVVREWGPSVVNISTEQITLVTRNPRWGSFDQLWGQDLSTVYGLKTKSLGSGVIVRSDGVIATNAHVVKMASQIYVTFQDGSSLPARLLGSDDTNDLALIAVDAGKPLKPIRFAEDVMIGETVLSLGNPFGLQNSVSQGIISGTNRSFQTNPPDPSLRDLIQTDAAAHPGSSGGALLNLEGKLAGINLALYQGATDISFAIPVYKLQKMMSAYEKVRSVVRPVRR